MLLFVYPSNIQKLQHYVQKMRPLSFSFRLEVKVLFNHLLWLAKPVQSFYFMKQ